MDWLWATQVVGIVVGTVLVADGWLRQVHQDGIKLALTRLSEKASDSVDSWTSMVVGVCQSLSTATLIVLGHLFGDKIARPRFVLGSIAVSNTILAVWACFLYFYGVASEPVRRESVTTLAIFASCHWILLARGSGLLLWIRAAIALLVAGAWLELFISLFTSSEPLGGLGLYLACFPVGVVIDAAALSASRRILAVAARSRWAPWLLFGLLALPLLATAAAIIVAMAPETMTGPEQWSVSGYLSLAALMALSFNLLLASALATVSALLGVALIASELGAGVVNKLRYKAGTEERFGRWGAKLLFVSIALSIPQLLKDFPSLKGVFSLSKALGAFE